MDYELDETIYTPGKFKYIEANDNINNVNTDDLYQKNFVNGLKNARQILNSLQKSIQKNTKYEKQLMKCRCSHHSHAGGWMSDYSDYKTVKSETLNDVNLTKSKDSQESVSSPDAHSLKFQYEELFRRYESLQQAYDERCRTMAAKDLELAETRRSVREAYEEIAQTHRTLISMGEKYLALKCKNQEQKQSYCEKLQQLRLALRSMAGEVERARSDLDAQLACSVTLERDAATALLLNEIKKCNLLYMDNVRLKELLTEIATQDD